jgi:hypothetical protein
VRFAGWFLDLGARELISPAGESVRLTGGEFSLLATFIAHANQVLSRDRLLDMVCGREAGALRPYRDEVRAFIRDNLPTDIRDRMRLGHSRARRTGPLAAHPQQEGLGGAFLAEGIRRPRLVGDPAHDLPGGEPGRPAPETLSFNITMIGPVLIQFGTEAQKSASCRAPPISTIGGARVSRNPAPGPTSPR